MKRVGAVGGVVILIPVLVIAPLAWQYFVNFNFMTVEEDVVYRSRQMTGDALDAYIKKYGIKTVVNFRAEHKGTPWYDDEIAACKRNGVDHFDFSWSQGSIPAPESLARYLDLMASARTPVLLHCQGGTHRAGTGAAVYQLMQGKSPDEARKQFTLGFNDAPIGELVDLYEGSSKFFQQWVDEDYPALYAKWKEEQAAKEAAEEE